MFIPDKSEESNAIQKPEFGKYILYGWKQSYFTQKLEAALIFYNATHELRRINPDEKQEIRHRAGTHQIPVLHTPETG